MCDFPAEDMDATCKWEHSIRQLQRVLPFPVEQQFKRGEYECARRERTPLVLIGVSREAAYTKSMLGNRSARTIPTKEGA